MGDLVEFTFLIKETRNQNSHLSVIFCAHWIVLSFFHSIIQLITLKEREKLFSLSNRSSFFLFLLVVEFLTLNCIWQKMLNSITMKIFLFCIFFYWSLLIYFAINNMKKKKPGRWPWCEVWFGETRTCSEDHQILIPSCHTE